MLISKMFSVLDSKTGGFTVPFAAVNVGSAVRTFRASVGDPSSLFFRFPEDFSLYLVGEFEQDSGMLSGCVPECVATGVQVKGE